MLSILLPRSLPLSKSSADGFGLRENLGLQNGYGCTSRVRGYDPSGCHLHSHGVNEIHTNSECTQVPSVLKLEAMLSLPYPAYAVPVTRVCLHASPKSEVSSKAPLIIHNHRQECRSSSHTQKSHPSIPSRALRRPSKSNSPILLMTDSACYQDGE